ncbi:unnamed protein product [Lactuca virosa]|uniref:Poly(A) polymerase nucleotidyltransferase domain-containing protein n=1 Tax=Lactuca virosa TaxID=75947 RepID=A0AAU9PBX2_9ASTR|nr:unnamed protein product [Lactuca virosa]
MPDVTELHPVPEAHVPMMKFKLNGVSIYLLYAKLSLWVIPEPATSDFIVRDTGNCSPRYMRCTINQIPCTSDLLNTSGMQLALLVQPLALPHPSEEPIQEVLKLMELIQISFGVIGDGVSDDTKAFRDAWKEACFTDCIHGKQCNI